MTSTRSKCETSDSKSETPTSRSIRYLDETPSGSRFPLRRMIAVNVHSKNDKHILTNLQETNTNADTGRAGLICYQLYHDVYSETSASQTAKYTDRIVVVPVVMQRRVTTTPDSSEATTGACDSESPEDRGGLTGAAQCQSRGRASDQGTVKFSRSRRLVQKSTSELDECGTKATETRQKQHADCQQ